MWGDLLSSQHRRWPTWVIFERNNKNSHRAVTLHFNESTTPWNLVRSRVPGIYTHVTYSWWVWTPDSEGLSLFTWKNTSLTRVILPVIFVKCLWDLKFMAFLRGGRIIWPLLTLEIHFFFFNWRIIAFQCCVSFYCTVKWISYMYTDIPSL